MYHGKSGRKPSGGRRKEARKKRRYEIGSPPALTSLGEPKLRKIRCRGGNFKLSLLSCNVANVSDGKTTKKVKILDVVENPANPLFSKRRIMTKGCIIRTEMGDAIITSRPGQDGVVNAKLIRSVK